MKIAVLASGGVDSSVALRLLKEEGHDITAFYLKIWLQDEFSFLGDCPWEEDLSYIRAVCKQAEIPFEVLNLQTEYWDSVVKYTIEEIREGRTPNPDIFCNSLIKFGQFYDKIDKSFEKVATGHYALVEKRVNKFILKQAPDPVKDQTYFLAYLTQTQLSRALFPLGHLDKKQVRTLAQKFDLPNKERKDSQGICFLGQIKFNEFVKHHLGEIKGEIVEYETNKKLGEHNGYYFYTIGQRSGLGLSGGPWYVVKKDIAKNIIYISRENLSHRSRSEFYAGKFNWIKNELPAEGNYNVKIRHGARFYNCNISFVENENALIKIDVPDQGIAPGQFAVIYDNDECLGGGVILSD
ncbi:MAG: tRNA 2-thiouridine(34) synthase MnmA [Ignavibacteria bacterium CG2_30_36_16]|nr:MAG: tRNA 2-thiouridine(34) synthase MnmA [Ignavibacteria bacterium CG2_30_36_16]